MIVFDSENSRSRSFCFLGLVFAVAALFVVHAHTNSNNDTEESLLRAADEGNSQPHLDFAVVGFAKTGTTYLLHYLLNVPETDMGGDTEHCLGKPGHKQVDKFLSLYKHNRRTEDGIPVKNGLKCPKGLTDEFNVANYEKYLPDARFIVSVRHPVWWFQSFYNYRLKQHINHGKEPWSPNPEELIGPCNEGSPYVLNTFGNNETHREGVCTDGAKFHHYLSRFGKTPMKSKKELSLLEHDMSIHSFPDAKIFLMEIGQLSVEHNQTEADIFVEDMKNFIGLENDLPPLKFHASSTIPEEITRKFIDICDSRHDFIRSILVDNGREAYRWIRDYFVRSPDVVISSPYRFLELIEEWQRDPCVSEDAV